MAAGYSKALHHHMNFKIKKTPSLGPMARAAVITNLPDRQTARGRSPHEKRFDTSNQNYERHLRIAARLLSDHIATYHIANLIVPASS